MRQTQTRVEADINIVTFTTMVTCKRGSPTSEAWGWDKCTRDEGTI